MVNWWLANIVILFLSPVPLATLEDVGAPAVRGKSSLYVVNTLSESISVIDLSSNAVAATIPLGTQGYRLALHPDGRHAAITTTRGALIVDLKMRTVVRRIDVSLSPLASAHITPDGNTLLVVSAGPPGLRNEERGRAMFLDWRSGNVTHEMGIGLNPLESVMTQDGRRLFVLNWASRDVTVIDVASRRLQDSIPLGATSARTMAASSDGRTIYLIQDLPAGEPGAESSDARALLSGKGALPSRTGTLCMIDVESLRLARRSVPLMSRVYALAVSPDGRQLFVHGRPGGAGSPRKESPRIAVTEKQALNEKQVLTEKQALTEKQVLTEKQALTEKRPPSARSSLSVSEAEQLELVVLSTDTFQMTRSYGLHRFSALAAGDDRLYLIGTPGDPARETAVQKEVADFQSAIREKTGGQPLSPAAVAHMLELLKPLTKTMTILDAASGKTMKMLNIGSLPQGVAVGAIAPHAPSIH